jgi:hypothetical protein
MLDCILNQRLQDQGWDCRVRNGLVHIELNSEA